MSIHYSKTSYIVATIIIINYLIVVIIDVVMHFVIFGLIGSPRCRCVCERLMQVRRERLPLPKTVHRTCTLPAMTRASSAEMCSIALAHQHHYHYRPFLFYRRQEKKHVCLDNIRHSTQFIQ